MTRTAVEFPADLPWLNAAHPLTLADLAGRVILLHFFSCGQMAALDPLSGLETLIERLGGKLAILGVHCPAFPAERDREHLRQNLFRLGYRLPLIQDRAGELRAAYGPGRLPALALIAPDKTLVALAEGPDAGRRLAPDIAALATGLDDRPTLPLRPEENVSDPEFLFFPEGLLAASDREIFVADTGHHRLVFLDVERSSLRGLVTATVGDGQPGLVDGPLASARFNRPMGLCFGADGRSLLVADAGNQCLRRVDIVDKFVETVAGPWTEPVPAWPTGVALAGGRPVVTLAGRGQVARVGPDGQPAPMAEDLVEPRGLAVRGENLFVADAGAGTILRFGGDGGESVILAGPEGLEHPQDACLDVDGRELFVADSYQHKIRRLDTDRPSSGLTDLAGKGRGSVDGVAARFFAPGAVSAAGRLVFVVDTVNHHVRFVDLDSGRTETLRLG